MSDTYTKLFSSITASTVWGEPYATRIVWVAMLAMADARGEVYGSVPGLARHANVTTDEARAALASFCAPDPDSRTDDNEGRRIEDIDGGWRLLNHAKYAAIRSEAERREYKRQWDRDNRPSGHARQSDSPTASDKSPSIPTAPTPPALTPALRARAKDKTCRTEVRRFADFWSAYPRREGKKKALGVWQSKQLEAQADAIIADVVKRKAQHRPWREGFVPHAERYLRDERWADEIDATAPKTSAANKPLPDDDDLGDPGFDWRQA